eukprot:4120-Heterococcus_DN1.PRE.1
MLIFIGLDRALVAASSLRDLKRQRTRLGAPFNLSDLKSNAFFPSATEANDIIWKLYPQHTPQEKAMLTLGS